MDVDYLASLVHGCTNFFALTKAHLFRELSVSHYPYECGSHALVYDPMTSMTTQAVYYITYITCGKTCNLESWNLGN